jgi:heme-degrading monooxygenase HmoA
MLARIARYEVEADRCDDALDAFTEAGGEIAQMQGFMGGYVCIDSENGGVFTCTFWEDHNAAEASATRATSARHRAVGAVDGEIVSVQTFDVVRELRPSG